MAKIYKLSIKLTEFGQVFSQRKKKVEGQECHTGSHIYVGAHAREHNLFRVALNIMVNDYRLL